MNDINRDLSKVELGILGTLALSCFHASLLEKVGGELEISISLN